MTIIIGMHVGLESKAEGVIVIVLAWIFYSLAIWRYEKLKDRVEELEKRGDR